MWQLRGVSDQSNALAAAAAAAAAVASQAEAAAKSTKGALPSGWAQVNDPSAGTFYHNAATGATSW